MKKWTTAFGIAALCAFTITVASAQKEQPQPQPVKQPAQAGEQPGKSTEPRFDAARFLKDHDKNSDRKLGKEELPAGVQEQFAEIDTNKDTAITQEELQAYANRMAQRRPQLVEVIFYALDVQDETPTIQELQDAYDELRKVDKNNDGKIDESELKVCQEHRKKERLDSIMTSLDRNQDGKIGKDEARGLWADNFAQLDKNSDGALDRQEIDAACSMRSDNTGSPNTKSGR